MDLWLRFTCRFWCHGVCSMSLKYAPKLLRISIIWRIGVWPNVIANKELEQESLIEYQKSYLIGATTFTIMTFIITTLGIMKLPCSITYSAIILVLDMLSVCILNIVMLSVAVFRYSESFMLSVVMLNVWFLLLCCVSFSLLLLCWVSLNWLSLSLELLRASINKVWLQKYSTWVKILDTNKHSSLFVLSIRDGEKM